MLVPAGIQGMTTYEALTERVRNLGGAPQPQLVEPIVATSLSATEPKPCGRVPRRRLSPSSRGGHELGQPGLLASDGRTQLIGRPAASGLLTRILGLALCVVVGALFVLGSWPLIRPPPRSFILTRGQSGRTASASSACARVSGAGGMGLDRLIFGKSRPHRRPGRAGRRRGRDLIRRDPRDSQGFKVS